MATNVEVKSKPGENTMNLLRRFSRKVRQANVVGRSKGTAEHSRKTSDFLKKKNKLRKISKGEEYKRLYKLGKIDKRGRRK